jgi:PleD family two-component response regulator
VLSVSIGVADLSDLATPSMELPHELCLAADRALYEAKGEGKNRICFYQETPLKVVKANGRE